jgi:hypothetical protein
MTIISVLNNFRAIEESVFYFVADAEISLSSRKTAHSISSPTWWFLTIYIWGSRDIEAEYCGKQNPHSSSSGSLCCCTWNMQGPGEQDFQRRALESPSNLSKVSDSTYVLGLEEVDSNKNEMSLSNDRSNIVIQNQVSVDSSSLRSPVDSMLGDEHRQLLGHHSTRPVITSPTWGGRAHNFSSKSSSSTRRYNFQYSKLVARRLVLSHTWEPVA